VAVTLQQCMTGARSVLQDTVGPDYRVSDADLVDYGNDALYEIALRRPDLFSFFGDIPLTAGETLQKLPAGAIRLMDIIRVKGGRVVKECSASDLDGYNVNWHSAAAAVTENFIRHPRDPVAFYVSPPAPVNTTLTGQWAKAPTALNAGDPIPIADVYKPIIEDYMIWRAEARDDEYVSAPRAVLFLEAFNASLGVSAKTKATADSDAPSRSQRAPAQIPPSNPGAQQAASISASESY
jgi:hypothetical protein